MKTLPSTALRVVVVTSIDGIDGELGPVSESRLWEDSPDGTVLVFASEVCTLCIVCRFVRSTGYGSTG